MILLSTLLINPTHLLMGNPLKPFFAFINIDLIYQQQKFFKKTQQDYIFSNNSVYSFFFYLIYKISHSCLCLNSEYFLVQLSIFVFIHYKNVRTLA